MENDHFIDIYSVQAPAYERMIAAEDVDQNLLPALASVADFQQRRVLDLGTGTGRLPRLLAPFATSVVALDLFYDMLQENRRQRKQLGADWSLLQADMQALPFPSRWSDVVTAGWAIGHFCSWYKEHWQEHVDRVLREMQRVAKAEGMLIVLETLGTGRTTPAPPTEALARYYEHLENAWGFQRREVATDFQFESVEEAVDYTEFFFGPDLAQAIRDNNWARLPEWTGLWSRPAG